MFHHTVPSSKVRSRREVPSPLLSPQLREQGLSRKEEVKEGHGEAHPGRQVLSVVPEDLQEDNRQRDPRQCRRSEALSDRQV